MNPKCLSTATRTARESRGLSNEMGSILICSPSDIIEQIKVRSNCTISIYIFADRASRLSLPVIIFRRNNLLPHIVHPHHLVFTTAFKVTLFKNFTRFVRLPGFCKLSWQSHKLLEFAVDGLRRREHEQKKRSRQIKVSSCSLTDPFWNCTVLFLAACWHKYLNTTSVVEISGGLLLSRFQPGPASSVVGQR